MRMWNCRLQEEVQDAEEFGSRFLRLWIQGGSFSYLRVELGDMAAFLAAGNILLEAVVGAAGLGRSWTSYLAALIGRDSDALRIHVPALAEGFNLLDPIAVVVLISTSSLAMSGARLTSTINSLASVVGIVIIAFVMGVGFAHFDKGNLEPSFFPLGAGGVFRAAAVVYWSYTGFDMVATMAEETKNPDRDVPLGLLSSMSAITVVYCAMSLALVGMQRPSEIDANAAYSVAFAAYSVAFAATGMKWARYVVVLGALKGMTSGLLVGALHHADRAHAHDPAAPPSTPPWPSRSAPPASRSSPAWTCSPPCPPSARSSSSPSSPSRSSSVATTSPEERRPRICAPS